MTITIGSWAIPILFTVASIVWALWERKGDYGGFFPSMNPLVRLVGAVIASLLVWVLYLAMLLAVRP